MLLIYTVSFLLHIPARIPAIAPLRPDLLLLAMLCFSLISQDWRRVTEEKAGRLFLLLGFWILISIPFVEWPGSILRENWKANGKSIHVLSCTSIGNKERARFEGFYCGNAVLSIGKSY